MGSLQCTRKFPASKHSLRPIIAFLWLIMTLAIPTNPKPNLNERWIQAIRRNAKTTQSWACSLCPERTIFTSSQTLWDHAQTDHAHRLPSGEDDLKYFRAEFEAESRQKTTKWVVSSTKMTYFQADGIYCVESPKKATACGSQTRMRQTELNQNLHHHQSFLLVFLHA